MTVQPLLHYVEGNKSSSNLIVFLQGWPDNHKMWDWINWKQQLTKDNCLLFIDFPNTSTASVDIKWGQDFPIIVQRIRQTLKPFDSYKNKILVAHDWGCVYGYIFDKHYPKYLNQFISMDVPAYVELTTLTQKLMVIAYQLYLVIAFLIGGPIGKIMTQSFAKISKHNPPYFEQITAARNYPYFYFSKILFLSKYTPSCPIVYLYAKKKPFQFHGQRWMKYLNQNPGCQVHSFDAGHWFMKKYDKFVIELINRRVLAKL